ncbi:conserved exported protein of unknown function [Tenacibaculum soleae]|uniref:hypothetical protein n=1 Tax=Tenacibaculum soleae TaxID=447689 RepID=UPI003AB5489C
MNFNMFNTNAKTLLALTALATVTYSCSKNDLPSDKGSLKLSAKTTIKNARASKAESTVTDSNLEITKLLLNLKEFELEVDLDNQTAADLTINDQDWDDDGKLDSEDELELKGPFEVDLLSGQVSFLNVVVPVGSYEELEFEFGPSTDNQSELFGKSILIEGKIGVTPFSYSHNFTEKVEVDFEDPKFDIIVSEVDKGIVIDFNVNQLFDSTNGIDLSQAVDGDGDGKIVIDHSDIDGNKALAEAIKQKIIEALDLLDD